MKIGYYVQGAMDEAVVHGLTRRWCPDAELAEGRFRGNSRESFARDIDRSLRDLKDSKECDFLVVLTDADANRWLDVKSREWSKVPQDYRHLTLFGVADRNIECWLAIDRPALAGELDCRIEDIPEADPSKIVKRRFGLTDRTRMHEGKERVREFVKNAPLKSWIEGSKSFKDFYDGVRGLALRTECPFPNELEIGGHP